MYGDLCHYTRTPCLCSLSRFLSLNPYISQFLPIYLNFSLFPMYCTHIHSLANQPCLPQSVPAVPYGDYFVVCARWDVQPGADGYFSWKHSGWVSFIKVCVCMSVIMAP